MTVFLKQSTASQSVIIGAFVDDTDFKTVETGLTIANTDIKLMKNGAASVNKNSGGATHRINGDYSITLDATDTNTVGELRVSVDVAGALVVWATYQVLEETVFDLYYGSGDTGQVVLQGVTHTGAVIPTVTTCATTTTNTDMRGTESALLAASAPTNFGDMSITVTTGLMDITQGAADKSWGTAARTLTAATNITSDASAITMSASGIVGTVNLVNTTTANTDMRGTESALLAASAPTNFGDMSISLTTGLVNITQGAADKAWATAARTLTAATNITSDASAITMSASGIVGTVNLVNTTTANTDMRGTESALLAASAPTNFGDMSITATTGLMDITQAAADKPWSTTTRALTDKVDFALSAAADQSIADLILPPTNTAFSNIPFLFVAASDHVTPVTGATGSAVTRQIDGGSFAAGTGTIAEIGNGIYQYDASPADVNGKIITFRFTGTGGTPGAPDDTFVTVVMSV